MTGSVARSLLHASLAFLITSTMVAHADSNQTAHQHGRGLLQIAIEGNTLDILFRAPAASVTGFEHAPQNDQQEELVRNTRDWFEQTPLATFPGQQCEISKATILDSQPHRDSDSDSPAAHHSHDHGEAHSEYEVSQSIRCDGPGNRLHSPLTEKFRHLETLQVEWVSQDSQGSATLGQSRTEVTIGRE